MKALFPFTIILLQRWLNIEYQVIFLVLENVICLHDYFSYFRKHQIFKSFNTLIIKQMWLQKFKTKLYSFRINLKTNIINSYRNYCIFRIYLKHSFNYILSTFYLTILELIYYSIRQTSIYTLKINALNYILNSISHVASNGKAYALAARFPVNVIDSNRYH